MLWCFHDPLWIETNCQGIARFRLIRRLINLVCTRTIRERTTPFLPVTKVVGRFEMLYSDASRREEERKHLQANFWTLGPPRAGPRRDQSISNSLYHPIVCYTMWGYVRMIWSDSLRKLEKLMPINQLHATLPWVILFLRLSVFLPVLKNLFCFLFVAFGAPMRRAQ